MSDIYIPGMRSRFNSDQIVDDLMRLERVPRDRVEQNIETLQAQRGYWQEVGRRISSVRESARFLFSFQNPFNERLVRSGDDGIITATATREAAEQSYRFTVRQTAAADRFLSSPLDERMRIDAGRYTFSVGEDMISIDFRGGTVREFADIINRRGRDKIAASLIAIQSGTRSLLIESRLTGEANRLGFHDDAATLAVNLGMAEQGNDSRIDIPISANTIQRRSGQGNISVNDGIIDVGSRSSVSIPMSVNLGLGSPLVLRLETSTETEDSPAVSVSQPPPGPSIPQGSVSYGGVTISNDPSFAPLPQWTPPVTPQRIDDMAVLSLVFTDGSSARLPPITDSSDFTSRQYVLGDIAQGRSIASLRIENNNTHRNIQLGNIEIFDPTARDGGLRPVNAVSTARDAIISMEGIDITRPTNNIDDLIPGLTLNVRGVSDRPVELNVRADTERVKDAIITFVGNYNRLMAEINVLTRQDERILDELTYLSNDERAQMRQRLGVFSGDNTLITLRNNLQRIVTAPYPTSLENELSMLAQIGISSNANRSTGYDPSRLRGYLDIDERALDNALETRIPAIRELFANDTTGDMLADTGVAFNMDALIAPFVQTGGIISLKTNTIDSRISQDERRIATLDRQLAAREQELRLQYARMESAYARMEQMSNSFENFNQQQRNNR